MARLAFNNGQRNIDEIAAAIPAPFHAGGNAYGERYNFTGSAIAPSSAGELPSAHALDYQCDLPNIQYVILSYSTPIAWLVRENGETFWRLPSWTYGPSTSKHQSAAHALIRASRWPLKAGVEL